MSVRYSVEYTFDCWEIFKQVGEGPCEPTGQYSNVSRGDALRMASCLAEKDAAQGHNVRVAA